MLLVEILLVELLGEGIDLVQAGRHPVDLQTVGAAHLAHLAGGPVEQATVAQQARHGTTAQVGRREHRLLHLLSLVDVEGVAIVVGEQLVETGQLA